jgi:hypothetical protein
MARFLLSVETLKKVMKTHTFISFRKFNDILRGCRYGLPQGTGSLNKRPFPTWWARAVILTVIHKIGLNLFLDDT